MMRVQIRDKEALGSLTPENLRAYLESQGWGNDRPWGQWGTILSKEQKGKLWEIVIPLRDEGYGYAEFMGLMVATLAEAEDRSQLDVFYDLANADADMTARANDKAAGKMANVWCVRAEKGQYTGQFVAGGYIAAGWLPKHVLAAIKDIEEIRRLFEKEHPEITENQVVGWHIGQIDTFSLKINVGDYVITPEQNASQLWYGRVVSKPYRIDNPNDGCPWPNRRKVDWAKQPLDRNALAEPFQKSLKHTQLAVFEIRHREAFLAAIVKMLWPYAHICRRSPN